MDHKVGDWISVAHHDKPDACPMPAVVAFVNEDKTVNVCAFNHLGQPMSLSNLKTEPCAGRYHVHQEKKHEPKHEESRPKHEPAHRGRPPKHR